MFRFLKGLSRLDWAVIGFFISLMLSIVSSTAYHIVANRAHRLIIRGCLLHTDVPSKAVRIPKFIPPEVDIVGSEGEDYV